LVLVLGVVVKFAEGAVGGEDLPGGDLKLSAALAIFLVLDNLVEEFGESLLRGLPQLLFAFILVTVILVIGAGQWLLHLPAGLLIGAVLVGCVASFIGLPRPVLDIIFKLGLHHYKFKESRILKTIVTKTLGLIHLARAASKVVGFLVICLGFLWVLICFWLPFTFVWIHCPEKKSFAPKGLACKSLISNLAISSKVLASSTIVDMSNSESSTILELERKLRDLEEKFLGLEVFTQTSASLKSVEGLAPISGNRSRVQKFLSGLANEENSGGTSPKLPAARLPLFDGSDLDIFLKDFERFLRLTGLGQAPEKLKLDWLIEACSPKVKRLVEKACEEMHWSLSGTLQQLEKLFPKIENDLTVRASLEKLVALPQSPEPAAVAQLFLEMDELMAHLSEKAMSDQEKYLVLLSKIHPKMYQEIRGDRFLKGRSETYESLREVLMEKANDDWLEKQLQKRNVTHHALKPLVEVQDQSPPPEKGGKGKGGKGKGGKGKGGRGPPGQKPPPQNRFTTTIFCKFCKKKGHYESRCFSKFPELRPKEKSTENVSPGVVHEGCLP